MTKKKYKSNLKVNQAEIQFTSKSMTAYGGFSLIAAFFEKIQLKKRIEEIIPIVETSPRAIGIFPKILSYFLIILAGGVRFSHLFHIDSDHNIFKKLFNIERLPKASTTLTRMFKKIKSWQKIEDMSDKLWDYLFSLIPWSHVKEDFLTFDSSVLVRYGEQEGAKKGYNPKKPGRPSHHPLLAFLNRSRYIVNLWNRAGNVYASENIIEYAQQTYERLKDRISIIGILADSSFYDIDFIKYIESIGQNYVIAVRLYTILQEKILSELHWKEVDTGIQITEFMFRHINPKWDKERRYIVIRQKQGFVKEPLGKQLTFFPENEFTKDYRYSAYVTNDESDTVEIWRKYRPRANDENRVREFKEDFGFEGFSMQKFYSTEAAMLIRLLLYNLFNLFRNEILPKSEHGKKASTIRFKYWIIPAIAGIRGNQSILRLGVKSKKHKSKLIYLLSFIEQWLPPVQIQMQCN